MTRDLLQMEVRVQRRRRMRNGRTEIDLCPFTSIARATPPRSVRQTGPSNTQYYLIPVPAVLLTSQRHCSGVQAFANPNVGTSISAWTQSQCIQRAVKVATAYTVQRCRSKFIRMVFHIFPKITFKYHGIIVRVKQEAQREMGIGMVSKKDS
jgi:hypothetical protein